ncbi:hypothetical protein AB0F11_25995 [Streptomyces sp. NPDC032472]|uniref:hypothetical protein n=1 Tax=Streptomyces sp. NPDC032472 TaxID=3155018 RepID=UPI0033DB1D9C
MFPQSTESDGRSGHTGAARVGKWTYTPAPTDWAQDKSATLHDEEQEVDLHYSSSIFEEFLEAMSRIQNDFNQRSQDVARFKTAVGERCGQMSRV